MSADLWVPRTNESTHIAPGSGIVGRSMAGGKVLVYYEGNLYDAVNMRRYVERVLHAWGRMDENYPTIAKATLDRQDLVWIGKWSSAMGRVLVDAENRAVLANWLGMTTIPESELTL